MRVIRAYPAYGVIACYDENGTGGDRFDFNAARNAPAKSPSAYLDSVYWHSDFFPFELSAGPVETVVNHAAVATSSYSFGIPGSVELNTQGNVVAADHLLYAHGLGIVPEFFVSLNGSMLTNGTVAQVTAAGIRFVCAYATTSQIRLREVAAIGASTLAAASLTYTTLVFNAPAADPAKPLASLSAGTVELGRGKISSARKRLRQVLPAESSFDFDLGPTVGVRNGGVKQVTGGNVLADSWYSGGFSGPSYVPVGV